MKSYSKLLFLICFVFSIAKTQAQRMVPIGSLPMYYNGGFAGESANMRVASYSYLKTQVGQSYTEPFIRKSRLIGLGTFASADQFFTRISTGVGIAAGVENLGDVSKGTYLSAAISPKISLKGKYTFAPFASISYEQVHTALSYKPDFDSKNLNINSGFLINSSKAYIGMSADVIKYATDLTTFNEKWYSFTAMTYTLQGGYTFQRLPESPFAFTPQLVLRAGRRHVAYDPVTQQYKEKKVIELTDLNLMFRYEKFIGGINNMGLALGYQTERFKLIMTNYYSRKNAAPKTWDLSDDILFYKTSTFDPGPRYSGSIALRYVLRKKEQPKMPGFSHR